MKEKKKMNPVWFLIIGIFFLIVPSAIYVGFLIPQMKEEYVVLMASGGAIGSAGITACSFIPETAKYGTLYKTASKSFTLLTVITLVQDFIGELLGLAAVFAVCFIIFIIMKGLWRDGKQAKQNERLAKEVARGVAESTK